MSFARREGRLEAARRLTMIAIVLSTAMVMILAFLVGARSADSVAWTLASTFSLI